MPTLPEVGELHRLLEYRDGVLVSRVKRHLVEVGDILGSISPRGYLIIKLDNKDYKAHRIVYKLHHGTVPDIVDHIDGNPLNNKIENLRSASSSQSLYNRRRPINNKSGVKGVCWNKRNKKWFAQCYVEGKQHHLGSFDSLEEASKCLRSFRETQHGAFCNHG